MKFFNWIYTLFFILISSVILGFIAVLLASAKYENSSGAGFEGVFFIGVWAYTVLVSVSAQLLLIGGFLIFKGAKNGD